MIIMIYDYIINRNTSNLIIIIIISMTTLMLTSTLEIVFYPDIAYSYTFNITNKFNTTTTKFISNKHITTINYYNE